MAEVTSTPWGERHAYVLVRTDAGPSSLASFEKRLHVSPFMAMEQRYLLARRRPGPDAVGPHREPRASGRRPSTRRSDAASFRFTRRPPRRLTARYPAATLRVLALIYGHALALKLKGVPVHPRPQVPA